MGNMCVDGPSSLQDREIHYNNILHNILWQKVSISKTMDELNILSNASSFNIQNLSQPLVYLSFLFLDDMRGKGLVIHPRN